jgi:hypothetical protein
VTIYKKIKKQNGEAFARTLRDFHNGLLEVSDIDQVLRYAGRGANTAQSLLPYLMTLLAANESELQEAAEPQDPFVLLNQAGYEAFHADTLEKQNSIKEYFKQGELLCTFNDHARYQNYHMVHAVKKNVEHIKREDFNGKEERQDEYGTSVISIQMRKSGGFISIKNRYNHAVAGCDNTFNSHPDNIIDGLSAALKTHFDVKFTTTKAPLPNNYTLMKGKLLKCHTEYNNIYYGDQFWAEGGSVHEVNKSAGDALFDNLLFDNKTKTLKKIDPDLVDSFADDFNRAYGGDPRLTVHKGGNLTLNGETLIGAEQSRIKTLNLPELRSMGKRCLGLADTLTAFDATALTTMGDSCLYNARALTAFNAPRIRGVQKHLEHFYTPKTSNKISKLALN